MMAIAWIMKKNNDFNAKQPLMPNILVLAQLKTWLSSTLTHQNACFQNLLVHWWSRLGRNVCQIIRAIKSSSWFLAPLLREMLSSYKLRLNKCDCSSKMVCMLSVALSSVTVKPGIHALNQSSKVCYFHHAYSTVQCFPMTYINFFFLSLK